MRQYNPNPKHPKKTAGPTPPAQVIFVPSPEVMEALRTLVATGLFGANTDECAHQLLRERIRDLPMLHRGQLPRTRGKR